MNYIGQLVLHEEKYGLGIVNSQDDKGYIWVHFARDPELKKFSTPGCFKQHLKLLGEEAIAEFEREKNDENASKEHADKKKQQEAIGSLYPSGEKAETKRPGRDKKMANVPFFSSFAEFCDEEEKALREEIFCLKKSGGKKIKLIDGKIVEERSKIFIYSFESESELTIPDNTEILLWLPSSKDSREGIPGTLVNCEDFTVIVACGQRLGENVPEIEFSAQTWHLLETLIERLQSLRDAPSPITDSLVCDGHRMIRFDEGIRKGQDTAVQMSLSQPITFIWGPPGTGKTETLAKIALAHLEKGHRVLMLSYSNVSVDGAIWRVFHKDEDKKPGKLIRYGYPRDKALMQHDYLPSYNLALMTYPKLLDEHDSLIEERKHLSRTSPRYVEISERLTRIRKHIKDAEKEMLGNASFVATTVSKATVDGALYNATYDTVIFDEASMAYIPQIVFAASLAHRHFVCMGDFAQLPPIVQSDNRSILNADIFNYCGIVEAVESGYGHGWLCMLDVQYRMHPVIADFSSRTMYGGLLKSGETMANERQTIVEGLPFKGDPLRLVDLSGMMSVCTKTGDQSRINVLSAFIAFGLASNAAVESEVGIITPYHAQSRLLHAMARDVADTAPYLHKITCATVHQFQGSEKDVIIYDAVDCYRMTHPGTLLVSTVNNYANRLYNVAITRARGKMVSIANVDYMRAKKCPKNLIFRDMMESLTKNGCFSHGESVISAAKSPIMALFTMPEAGEKFISDLDNSSREIDIDIPGGTSGSALWFEQLSDTLQKAKKRGVKVFIRTDRLEAIQKEIRSFAIENCYITDPVAVIDKKYVWYGMPPSDADFISEGRIIPTRFRPIFRFQGRHFSQALYGFLSLSKKIDSSVRPAGMTEGHVTYNTFASYVSGEIKCSRCGGRMKLKKGRASGKFFLGCENYPRCDNTQLVELGMLEKYFYFGNSEGKRCPQDNTSLEARAGRYGVYVCCNGFNKHTFRLDEV